jgi:hypothetical protein
MTETFESTDKRNPPKYLIEIEVCGRKKSDE